MRKIKRIVHKIWCEGKLISRHSSLYLAQSTVEKQLRTGNINNNYCIESAIEFRK